MKKTPTQEKYLAALAALGIQKLPELSWLRQRRVTALLYFFQWTEGDPSGLPFLIFLFWWTFGAIALFIFDRKEFVQRFLEGWRHKINDE